MISVYEYSSYPKYLRALTKFSSSPLSVSALAVAAGVQRPYMSNVIAEKAFLSREQGYRLAKHLGLDNGEMNYLLTLVEIARAGSEYREFLKQKCEKIKQESERLEDKLKRNTSKLDSQITAEYFSTWEFCAVHIIVSIPEYQTLKKISRALSIPPKATQICLDKLQRWGLIHRAQGRYQWKSGNVHLPAGSHITRLHHRNWRERAVENAKIEKNNSIHFTSVYSMAISDAEKARRQILQIIKDYSDNASRSKEETTVCLNVDLFVIQS